jgi:hypothetical protein
MAPELAMAAVFLVSEITKALSHHAWTECVAKLRLGGPQPTDSLLGVSSEQPHEVLHLDELSHQCRR